MAPSNEDSGKEYSLIKRKVMIYMSTDQLLSQEVRKSVGQLDSQSVSHLVSRLVSPSAFVIDLKEVILWRSSE